MTKIDQKQDISQLQQIEMELLLEAVYRHYGYDFRNYSAPFVQRRILNRMVAEKQRTISGLQEKVLHDPLVMKRLFKDFSINVTEMFRDPSFFESLREKVIPLVRNYPAIRIWHVGCGSGEEVYSMAILLHESGILDKTRIYATDINQDNLEKAKQGSFPLEKMKLYTTNYIQSGGEQAFSEYYSVKNDGACFSSFLKKNMVFFQHNVVTDQSFNEFHIIICRNVMIYFNKKLQNHVHQLVYESLFNSGFLGLGNREEIRFTNYAEHYEVLHSAEKLYRKIN
ncbi:protein-glutamate O-methyltransferase CheR [Neobacillus drentensis]|uniref:CheR family methyltransferase n=1 Tax=Neobacillus drentensis TaxID=220684 RepID=UPI001F2E4A55|nr:protein-glutamate O-methyltransferase CheR [Neobacillus drentensis]ULT54412.1 protein-glutamate O-methyltransferase CheR [Neobacillus drentensis]